MRFVLMCFFVLCSFASTANNVLDELILPKQPQFLKVNEAFKLDFDQQGNKLFVIWDIAPGYYLYKEKLEFVAKQASLTAPELPKGSDHEDEFFGKTEVYFDSLTLTIKLDNIGENAVVKIRYQGCAEAGLCYPPEVAEIPLTPLAAFEPQLPQPTVNSEPSSVPDSLSGKLANQSFALNLVTFFLLGTLLAFTPCVFPMFPILSSLIAGTQNLSTKRAFVLSFIYVQGMALTYALLGLVVAALGGQVQAYIQHPAVLVSFSILFVVLALSMFGVYELKLPERWMTGLTQTSNKQQGGNYLGVFMMGILSGLIASPCTTAPLSAALLYVAQSGDYLVGGFTLYALSLGMGLPLLLLGTSGGKLLPKAGAWMDQVKTMFGFVMLVVPLVLLERIVPWTYIAMAGAVLGFAAALYLHYCSQQAKSPKSKTFLWGAAIVLAFSALSIAKEQISPSKTSVQFPTGKFVNVANLAELKTTVEQANQQGKFVMVDLYAEWCVACKEFEKYTFPKPEVQAAFENYVLVKIDLTEPNQTSQEFMDYYQVLGLPTILLFDNQGNELTSQRITGFMKAKEFAEHLNRVAK